MCCASSPEGKRLSSLHEGCYLIPISRIDGFHRLASRYLANSILSHVPVVRPIVCSGLKMEAISGLMWGLHLHILEGMSWVVGGLILAAVGVLMRRILHMDRRGTPQAGMTASLKEEFLPIYNPIAQEVETHATILGITLNEAFGERDAGRIQMAWRVLRLALGEWERLTDLLIGLQDALTQGLNATSGVVAVRRVAVDHFKSRAVMDNVGLYEFLDQILFRSKTRFALQLQLLSRAIVIVTKGFKHACREGEFTLDSSGELWCRLDFYFHDFDLIAKETLLAFRTLLACQTPEGAEALSAALQVLLERGMRVSVSPSGR